MSPDLTLHLYIPIGRPKAKSLDCVTKMPKRPPFPMLNGLEMTVVKKATTANRVNLDTSIAPRKFQEMAERFKMARFLKRRAGRASFPTRVPMLLASLTAMILKNPKT